MPLDIGENAIPALVVQAIEAFAKEKFVIHFFLLSCRGAT